jgi:hypothetical protein
VPSELICIICIRMRSQAMPSARIYVPFIPYPHIKDASSLPAGTSWLPLGACIHYSIFFQVHNKHPLSMPTHGASEQLEGGCTTTRRIPC